MTDTRKIFAAAVVGPTASGKSALAAAMAKRLGGEVVSCDSMQIYKGMDIATAKPTCDEMLGVPHHLIGCVDPSEKLSVFAYCDMAREVIDDIDKRGFLAIICGGTGLYFNSLVDNVKFPDVKGDDQLRRELEERAENEGGEALLSELSQFDAETAGKLSACDTKRIVRAIEIYRSTGIPMSEHVRRSKLEPSPYEVCTIGLGYRDRQKLYDRINRRVDIMVENGLIEEARDFLSGEYGETSAQAIGYKELKPYFDGECSLECALDSLKQSTRRYAKRQISWFGRDERINRLYADDYESFEHLLDAACETVLRQMNMKKGE